MADKSLTLDNFRTLRKDNWWAEPLLVVVVLGGFGVYATWAAMQNSFYYAAPYLSPFYSPCISANCVHVTLPLIGSWWNLSPAFLILWVPGGFRATCYYYRKAYYRSFFQSPPACAVRDVSKSYCGETRFPFLLQNIHRYFFYLSLVVLAFLWWDALLAFRFPDGFGMGVGTDRAVGQRRAVDVVQPVVQFLPPCLRRLSELISQRAEKVQDLDLYQRSQRETYGICLG